MRELSPTRPFSRALSREYAHKRRFSLFYGLATGSDDIETACDDADDPECGNGAGRTARSFERKEQLEQQPQVPPLPKDPTMNETRSLRFAPARRRRRSRAVCRRSVPHVQPLYEARRWRVEIMSMSQAGEHGGYKEIIAKNQRRRRVWPTEI